MPCSASATRSSVAIPPRENPARGCAGAASSRGPPSISGNPVTSSTLVTSSPASVERGRRTAARDELEAELRETAREVGDARLVVDGDQRAHSSRTTFGSSRCSASCTRSRNVSTVSPPAPGRARSRSPSPVSTPSSTKCTVAAAAAAPAASTSSSGCAPGKRGKRRRMHVHDAARGSARGTTARRRCM